MSFHFSPLFQLFRAENELGSHKAVATLLEHEASQLESNVAAAESLLQQAAGNYETLAMATVHLKETNGILDDEIKQSILRIGSANEGGKLFCPQKNFKMLFCVYCSV